jgi:hypothetical protein
MKIANNMQDLTKKIRVSASQRKDGINRSKADISAFRLETADNLKEIHDSRLKSAEKVGKERAEGAQRLADDEKKRQQNVATEIKGFQTRREKTAAQMKKELKEGQNRRIAEVQANLTEVRNLIGQMRSERQKMTDELARDLELNRSQRKAAMEEMQNGFRKVRKEIQDDLKGAAEAWRDLGNIRPATASSENNPPEAPVEPPNLEEKLLTIINQHSEGISLSEVAKELGIVTIVLGKAARVLLEQGKINKRDKVYFPGAV